MSFIKRMLKYPAVYWPPAGTDKFGKPRLGDPIEVKCKWEDTVEEYVKQDGQTAVSTAHVFVDQDVKLSGRLWKGSLEDAPTDPLKGFEIQRVMNSQDLRVSSSEIFREVIL